MCADSCTNTEFFSSITNPIKSQSSTKFAMASFQISGKPSTILALALTLILLLSHNFYTAFGVSGGRMGGSSFSDSSSSSDFSSSYSSSSYYLSRSSQSSTEMYGCRDCNSTKSPSRDDDGIGLGVFWLVIFVGGFGLMWYLNVTRTNVLMVQVGLSGKARSLQRDLNGIAKATDTSTVKGWHYILTETTLALLRHPDYFISGYSSVDQKGSIEDAEKRFNEISSEEREKFDIESLVNVNNIRRQRICIQKASSFSKDYIVVTILVAARGVYRLPVIKDNEDLKKALRYLSSIPSSKTLGVEVLWTPQDENDALSEEELVENYTLLRPIW